MGEQRCDKVNTAKCSSQDLGGSLVSGLSLPVQVFPLFRRISAYNIGENL